MPKPNDSRIGRLKDELAKAKEKAAEWQARARDIERQITELENMEILRLVRSVAPSPEELRSLLERIQASFGTTTTNLSEEETEKHEM